MASKIKKIRYHIIFFVVLIGISLYYFTWSFGCGFSMGPDMGCDRYLPIAWIFILIGVILGISSIATEKKLLKLMEIIIVITLLIIPLTYNYHIKSLRHKFDNAVKTGSCSGIPIKASYSDLYRDHCYKKRGECEKIDDNSIRRDCYMDYSISPIASSEECYLIDPTGKDRAIETCKIHFAVISGDLSYCEISPDKRACYENFARYNTTFWKDGWKSITHCNTFFGFTYEYCLLSKAEFFKDPSICQEIKNQQLKRLCTIPVSKASPEERCSHLTVYEARDICIDYYK